MLALALRRAGVNGDLSAYAPEAVAARRALRSDTEIRALLDKWFDAVAGPPAGPKDPLEGRVVDRVAYDVMWGSLVDHVSGRLTGLAEYDILERELPHAGTHGKVRAANRETRE